MNKNEYNLLTKREKKVLKIITENHRFKVYSEIQNKRF